MAEVDVVCTPDGTGWRCRVRVRERGSSTEHEVRVTAADLARLDPGTGDPGRLVRAAFEFLLDHEPKESILRSFDLTLVGRYFPGWEPDVRERIAGEAASRATATDRGPA